MNLNNNYVNYVKCKAHRAFLANIRGGLAPLEIELGRYRGLEINQYVNYARKIQMMKFIFA